MMKRNVPVLCGLVVAAAVVVCGFLWAQAQAVKPAAEGDIGSSQFEALRTKVEQAGASAREEDVLDMLRQARTNGMPVRTSFAVQSYLRESQDSTPQVTLMGADVAALAGDYRTAITRYRRYLNSVQDRPADATDAKALAGILRMQIELLGDHAGAYRAMKEFGPRLRQSPEIRKFDEWFMNLALEKARQERQDLTDAASHLAGIFSESLPLELERYHYWMFLDEVMELSYSLELKSPFAALPSLKKLAAGIREDNVRSMKYKLYVDNLNFRATTAGRDEKDLERSFQPVIESASAYLAAAPTAETLKTIAYVLSFGFRDPATQAAQRSKFGAGAFEKLQPKDREEIIRWPNSPFVMGADGWVEVASRNADFFKKCSATASFRLGKELIFSPDNKALNTPEIFKKQSSFLTGVPSFDAAVINSIAAGAEDMNKGIEHLLKNESWHLTGRYVEAFEKMWLAYLNFPRDAKLPGDIYDKLLVSFGTQLTETPGVPLDEVGIEFMKLYLSRAWCNGPNEERIQRLHRFDWVPFLDDGLVKKAHEIACGQFDAWAKGNVQGITAADADAVRKELKGLGLANPEKAPNALCKAFAQAVITGKRKDAQAYLAAARQVYEQVKDCYNSKMPFGAVALFAVLPRKEHIDDFQCEVFADQLARCDPAGSSDFIEAVFNTILSGRNWLDRPEGGEVATVRKFIDALGKALDVQISAGKFSPIEFSWFRRMRSNQIIRDHERAQDVLAKMIEKKKAGADIPGLPSAVGMMWLLQNEFTGLQKQYPVAGAFEGIVAAEIDRTGKLEYGYYAQKGDDVKGDVCNAAARLLMKYDKLPLGYGGVPAVCSRADIGKWYERVLAPGAKTSKELRDQLVAKSKAAFGKTRFDLYAGKSYEDYDISQPAGRKGWFDEKVGKFLDLLKEAPGRYPLDIDFAVVSKLGEPSTLSSGELQTLVRVFEEYMPPQPDRNRPDVVWPAPYGLDTVIRYLHAGLTQRGEECRLFPIIPYMCKWARERGGNPAIAYIAQIPMDLARQDKVDLAVAYAYGARDIGGAGALGKDIVDGLEAVIRKASQSYAVIPVPPSDPRYPMFKAQLEYKIGNFEAAWEGYAKNANIVIGMLQDLDPNFVIWMIDHAAQKTRYDEAEKLAREMTRWAESSKLTDTELRARIGVAYAGIALAQKTFPTARARFESLLADQALAQTKSRFEAELGIADIDRQTKDYDQAMLRLEKMVRDPSKEIRNRAKVLMARVHLDQQNYKEAKDLIDSVRQSAPENEDAALEEGRVNIGLKYYEDARMIDTGVLTDRSFIVPGKSLRIKLEDRMATMVHKSSAIEMRVWTEVSGDEEFFALTPKGDVKYRFEGEIATEIAPVKKGDGKLQVLGLDKIHYDYSPAFAKAHNIVDKQTRFLTVVSDADIFVSSGAIVSPEERIKMVMEAELRLALAASKQQQGRVAPAKEKATLSAEEITPLSEVRRGDAVKPGNTMNIQVEDMDKSTSSAPDTVEVVVETSSGDRIDRVVLTETNGYSGVFIGAAKTAPAQATAYATDTAEGVDPNNTISPKEQEYADKPWQASQTPPKGLRNFGVDLNDNVDLKNLKVSANVEGHRIEAFAVQTSYDKKNFRTVGSYPENIVPWEGSLQAELVKFVPPETGTGQPATVPLGADALIFSQYIQMNDLVRKYRKVVVSPQFAEMKFGTDVAGNAGAMGMTGPDEYYICHLQGAFYVPVKKVLTFRLVDRNPPPPPPIDATAAQQRLLPPPRYAFSVTEVGGVGVVGGVGPGAAGVESYTIRRGFLKGVYRMDVYFLAKRDEDMSFEVQADDGLGTEMAKVPATMCDPSKQVRIKKAVHFDPAKIVPMQGNAGYDINFENTKTRIVQLVLLRHESDAPAIRRLTLEDQQGKKVLPAPADYLDLRKNDVLEVLSGDSITVTYKDDAVVSEKYSKKVLQAKMSVTFSDGSINACFVEFKETAAGESVPEYIPMVRYTTDKPVNVVVNDPDLDVSAKRDVVKFKVETVYGQTKEFEALETAEHSGMFVGKFFPVKAEAQREAEIQVQDDDSLTISYLDKENVTPGIPWQREVTVHPSLYVDPEVRVYACTSELIEEQKPDTGKLAEGDTAAVTEGDAKPKAKAKTTKRPQGMAAPVRKAAGPAAAAGAGKGGAETFETMWEMICERPELACKNLAKVGAAGGTPGAVTSVVPGHIDGPLLVEVLWPSVVVSPRSELSIFAQTSTGRKFYGKDPEGPFDVNVPGTIMISGGPGGGAPSPVPPQYVLSVIGDPFASSPLVDGRFTFAVPKILGDCPSNKSFVAVDAEGKYSLASDKPEPLYIRGDDEIFVGFRYTDTNNVVTWITDRIGLGSDAMLDVMDGEYKEPLKAIHVGEKAYFRVADKARDKSEEKDTLFVTITSSSGHSVSNTLTETFEHTGLFKGLGRPLHADILSSSDPDVVPCKYGDTVTVTYTPKVGAPISKEFQIFKGADGTVQPFSKRFKDPKIAVKTQFAMAEAYFEMAKKHRKLTEVDLARREIMQGKKLLEEALRDFPDVEYRDHADYLLANLDLEFADDTVNAEVKERYYRAAIGTFGNIVANHPESPFAPKSQYKKALTYEKMGLVDLACEEYVKLSYRYPQNELIAKTIARLGQYFWRKGSELEKQAKGLRESDDEKQQLEGEKLHMEAKKTFRTAAEVFGRLSVKFPQDELAGRTLVLSGQGWMLAEEYPRGIETFDTAIAKYANDVDICSEAMYWCGNTHFLSAGDVSRGGGGTGIIQAYRVWKKLTWDFPKTKWARFARGRLTEPAVAQAAAADAKNQ